MRTTPINSGRLRARMVSQIGDVMNRIGTNMKRVARKVVVSPRPL